MVEPYLSIGADLAWQIAAYEATAGRHEFIELEHLLIGICSLDKAARSMAVDRLPPQALDGLRDELDQLREFYELVGLNPVQFRRRLRRRIGPGTFVRRDRTVHRGAEARDLFERAREEGGEGEVTAMHLARLILLSERPVIRQACHDLGLDPAVVAAAVSAPLAAGSAASRAPARLRGLLAELGKDLARVAESDPEFSLVGRTDEVLRIREILHRKRKNCPLLVGWPGVGKRAILLGLAQRGVQEGEPGDTPQYVELDPTALVSGTLYRGELERRMGEFEAECRAHPGLVLCIDDLSQLLGSAHGQEGRFIMHTLTGLIERDGCRCIALITPDRYTSLLAVQSDIEHLFEPVFVQEPTPEESRDVLSVHRTRLERYHHVRIPDRALDLAVSLSSRFDTTRHLPEKAIDLVDQAAAVVRLERKTLPADTGTDLPEGDPVVTDVVMIRVTGQRTGIDPVFIAASIGESGFERIAGLRDYLGGRIRGQDDAIRQVTDHLTLAYTSLTSPDRPLGIFLFVGPTGVGKTETARAITDYLLGSEAGLIRLDMSEYQEPHSVSKLVGAPPGYVGYSDEGQLLHRLRLHPYSVVLLDEIEKAHPRVFDLLLQLFGDGRITDARGNTVDARHALFIMTSNIPLPADLLHETGGSWDTDTQNLRRANQDSRDGQVRQLLFRLFRPELVNRLDRVIVFRPLSPEATGEIFDQLFTRIVRRVDEGYELQLTISPEAREHLVGTGFSDQFGAREVQRVLDQQVLAPIAQLLTTGTAAAGSAWEVGCRDGRISLLPRDPVTRR